MTLPPPRCYAAAANAPSFAALPGAGLPQERLMRIAARRAFVDMKQQFIAAVADIVGPRGDWLRRQVRHAHEPIDLWLLRGSVFAALSPQVPESRRMRLDLHRALDSVFPDSAEVTPFMPLN